MQLGCCLPVNTFMPEFKNQIRAEEIFRTLIRGYRDVMEMGYDYVEATCVSIMEITEAELALLCEHKQDGSFGVRYANSFLPGTINLCRNREAAEAWATEAYRRLSLLGARALVFGSGAGRSYPADMDPAEGRGRFRDYLRFCEQCGEKYGIVTCIEPLQATENNQVSLVSEALTIIAEENLPLLRVTPDAFHMCVGGESPAVLEGHLDAVNHVHLSEAPGRVYPGKFGGAYVKELGRELHRLGYDGDLTVECGYQDFAPEMREAYRFVKENVL